MAHQIHLTLDDETAAQLAALAERAHAQQDELAVTLLSNALVQAMRLAAAGHLHRGESCRAKLAASDAAPSVPSSSKDTLAGSPAAVRTSRMRSASTPSKRASSSSIATSLHALCASVERSAKYLAHLVQCFGGPRNERGDLGACPGRVRRGHRTTAPRSLSPGRDVERRLSATVARVMSRAAWAIVAVLSRALRSSESSIRTAWCSKSSAAAAIAAICSKDSRLARSAARPATHDASIRSRSSVPQTLAAWALAAASTRSVMPRGAGSAGWSVMRRACPPDPATRGRSPEPAGVVQPAHTGDGGARGPSIGTVGATCPRIVSQTNARG